MLGVGAVFYLPGNSVGLDKASGLLLTGFALAAGTAIIVLGVVRVGVGFSVVVFSASAFFAAGRTIAGAALGLRISGGRRLAAMGVRTATVQSGYLLGAAAGGLLLERWGFTGLGWGLGSLLIVADVVQLPRVLSGDPLGSARQSLRRRRRIGKP